MRLEKSKHDLEAMQCSRPQDDPGLHPENEEFLFLRFRAAKDRNKSPASPATRYALVMVDLVEWKNQGLQDRSGDFGREEEIVVRQNLTTCTCNLLDFSHTLTLRQFDGFLTRFFVFLSISHLFSSSRLPSPLPLDYSPKNATL